MTLKDFLLSQILYQADGATGGSSEEQQEEIEKEIEETPEENNEETTDGSPENKSNKIEFTPEQQEEINRIIAERLARERKKQEAEKKRLEEEAERKRLKEQGEYKELAEKYQQELESLKSELLTAKKVSLLKDAGYTDEQAELFKDLLQGESDEELITSLETLKKANPPVKSTYVDPSLGNGGRNEPEKLTGDEIGRSAYQRLKQLGKIRRNK